jgi:hypothetical protein
MKSKSRASSVPRWLALAWAAASLGLAATESASAVSATSASQQDDDFACSLYLAPSSKSKSDDFKWGTYTAKTIERGERIGPETLAIPVYNFRAHNRRPEQEDGPATNAADGPGSYWDHLSTHFLNFMWLAEMGGAAEEQAADEADSLAMCVAMPGPGMSAAFDSPTAAANADWDVAAAYKRAAFSTAEAGRAHPGRAATSQFDRVTLRATHTIVAGSEVVVGYDDPVASSSAAAAAKSAADEHAITEDDFVKMDETISQMVAFFDKHSNLEDSAKQQIYQFLIQDFMEAAVGSVKARKVAEIMPPSPADLKAVQGSGGIRSYANGTGTVQRQRLEWLHRTGYCLDHVKPAPSNIPNAGLGAFATHRLGKGSVITPVPLLHIAEASALDMYDLYVPERCVAAAPPSSFCFLTSASKLPFIWQDSGRKHRGLVARSHRPCGTAAPDELRVRASHVDDGLPPDVVGNRLRESRRHAQRQAPVGGQLAARPLQRGLDGGSAEGHGGKRQVLHGGAADGTGRPARH